MLNNASSSCKTPPSWEDEKPFDAWKTEMELWQLVTDLAKTKQGPAVALSLHGRKREVAMEVSIDELKADTGLQTLLAKLEKAFAKEAQIRLLRPMRDSSP